MNRPSPAPAYDSDATLVRQRAPRNRLTATRCNFIKTAEIEAPRGSHVRYSFRRPDCHRHRRRRGLGRQHALEFARRGAKVVVNDLGGAVDGSGGSSAAAEAVVAEIKAAGGEAFADGASVTDDKGVANLVETTMSRWGRVDVLIANAGILRDKSFAKMELGDFASVVDVHLMGTVKPVKALWEIFRTQNYGRIVVTTSSTGLYGNFGQANYGAAKLALVGLMNTLKLEGAKNDIRVNAISPVAATRMTESLMPPEMLAKLGPQEVTPGVVYLASKDAPNGAILTAGAGVFALAQIVETEGRTWAPAPQRKPSAIIGPPSPIRPAPKPMPAGICKHRNFSENPPLNETARKLQRLGSGRRIAAAAFCACAAEPKSLTNPLSLRAR